ncbi:TonB-linked SusC/RagA family outer membrane protein [Dyadobacter sp. BE32]|uniref:TonB-linked SusC/RagA family outer membrane protein n=1 Tax=Dyadobacter fermentans TaxID=94254 RepID=A0ABU1QVP6_9BACT|nr:MULTISPECIES: TonB-dependent receptor [Dyadobacter]MDR6805228.1 TonB-linked SusC/RagA family outer membrane protein [Dyadobacter fermentans]MDR7043012.1 TonB-linked SusC/RagA family outer membrane protein [Dyadobacter sp. BE242]MDR7262777.1 TonB-linked SusC/RagA family outer membrane protein [Dyadobacter sp. BE32]
MKKSYPNYAYWQILMRFSCMQLIIAALLTTVALAGATEAQEVLNNRVTIQMQNQDVRKVLSAIEDQVKIKFLYSSNLIKAERKVSVNVKQEQLGSALKTILAPLDLGFEVSGNQIILKRVKLPVEKLNPQSYKSATLDRTISGTVSDKDGSFLPGVSVVVKGTARGTGTDAQGVFKIDAPDGNVTLTFSFVGFSSKDVEVAAGQSTVDVTLTQDEKLLNEVVVVGYGTASRKDLTGAVSIVKVSELTEQPNSNLSNQLQGRASGVTVLTSGQPGQAPQIRIRGINSFGNNTPLFVVDGVPTQDINNLNPNDVASMQVLKDAGSASIYGSRASNGVVIITTKRGQGKVKVSYDMFYGTQTVPKGNVYDILSPQGMADLKFLALKNSGATINDPQYGSGETPVLPDYIVPTGAKEGSVDLTKYYVNPNYTDKADMDSFYRIVKANKGGTDWFHEVFKNAPIQSHNLSVSGGGEQGNYLFSFNHFNQQGNLMNTYLKRYTIRANSQYNVTKHIRVGENIALTLVNNPRTGILEEGGGIGMAYRMQPIIPVYDIQGNYAGSFGSGLGNAKNPVAIRDRARNNRGVTNNLFGNMFAEVDFLKDFNFRTSFGGGQFTYAENTFSYPEWENSENVTTNSYSERVNSGYNWTWTNTVTYEHSFNNKHNVKVLLGTEAYNSTYREVGGSTQSYFSFDPNYTSLSTGSGTPTNFSNRSSDALFSYIGRIDYNFKDKYLLSGTLRRDGSSRFTSQYGWFPAVSAGWRLKEEAFMRSATWLTDLKIRGGWGIMGNQFNVDPANAFTTYGQNRSFAFYDIKGTGNSTVLGFQRTRVGNPNAKWEGNINSNIGIDASLFNGAIDFTIDYYQKNIDDLLFSPELAGTVGQGTAPAVNIGKMKNKGIDMSIYGEKTVAKDLKLNATVTLTTYNNKIVKITDGVSYFDQEGRRFNGSTIVRNAVNHSIGQFFGYNIVGFWNSQAEIDAANAQAAEKSGNPAAVYQNEVKVGRFRYEDVNGDGIITADDRTFLGNPSPKFSYGLNIGATYKNFDFGIFLYGVQGNQIWNNLKWWHDFYTNFQGAKSNTALYDSWRPDHMNATAPIQENTGSFSTTNVPNSYYVENGSYLRAKNAQIGYTLPKHLTQALKIDRLRVYVQTANLFTITKYSGPDPEVGQSQVAGSTAFGLDEGVYPNTRQFLVGLNLTF